MAGGAGSRLRLGEKPLVTIDGRPLLSYVLSAFEKAGYDVIIVTSPRTPFTLNWGRANGFECIRAQGHGYIPDLQETVKAIEETGPVFTCVADLPCLSAEHVRKICAAYENSGKEALSTWVSAPCRGQAVELSYTECIGGIDACPIGINIIRGDLIFRPQEEEKYLVMDPGLAYNINTRSDLENFRRFLSLSAP